MQTGNIDVISLEYTLRRPSGDLLCWQDKWEWHSNMENLGLRPKSVFHAQEQPWDEAALKIPLTMSFFSFFGTVDRFFVLQRTQIS